MNEKAKSLLGRCSDTYTPRTPEQIEEAKIIRHRADLVADRVLQRYENSQRTLLPYVLSSHFPG